MRYAIDTLIVMVCSFAFLHTAIIAVSVIPFGMSRIVIL